MAPPSGAAGARPTLNDGGLGGRGTLPAGSSGAAGDLALPEQPRQDDDPLPACQREVPVADSAELRAALVGAEPGDCLLLADGDYRFASVTARGQASAPIVIRPKNRGKASVSEGLLVFEGAAHVAIEGLTWRGSGNVQIRNSEHVRITRWRFRPQEVAGQDWIVVSGSSSFVRIDHNDIGPKHLAGNLVMLHGEGGQVVQHTRIDDNYFHDIVYSEGNGWEAIRAGLSQLALSSGFTTIEHNLFERCGGDPETISIKSSDNVVRYNTLLDSAGELTLRHGNRNAVYGNYIVGHNLAGTSGIRVCGRDHRVFNNYVQDIEGAAINLEGGDSDARDEAGTLHYRVYRAEVLYNTLVNSAGILIGGSHPLSPVDSVVANNILQGTGPLIVESGGPVNITYLRNLLNRLDAGGSSLALTTDQVALVDPELVPTGKVLAIAATSPAVDRGAGAFGYVSQDVEGKARSSPDVGAHEYSSVAGPFRPLTPTDVGPDAP